MRPLLLALTTIGLASLCLACEAATAPAWLPDFDAPAPERWINSAPLDRASLRGKPVLVEFWTFGCHNCRNTLPWMKRTAERYRARGLAIVAVHTPEFASERGRKAVAAATERLGIGYPVMLDDGRDYWARMNNRYWPAFFLYDGDGRLVASRIGELHAGDDRADSFEVEIRRLVEQTTRR